MNQRTITGAGRSPAKASSVAPKSAWQIACDAGLDMALVELSLVKSPWDRFQDHDRALALAKLLQGARRREHGPA